MKNLATLLLIIVSVGLVESARKNSPLLVEDEGSRRNRPAGECFVFLPFKCSLLFGGQAFLVMLMCPRRILISIQLSTLVRAFQDEKLLRFFLRGRIFFSTVMQSQSRASSEKVLFSPFRTRSSVSMGLGCCYGPPLGACI